MSEQSFRLANFDGGWTCVGRSETVASPGDQRAESLGAAGVLLLRGQDGVLRFEVDDDGRGFDVAAARMGSGLTNVADRLDALDGTFEIQSVPGTGTQLWGPLPAYELTVAADQASTNRSGLNSDLGMKPAAPTSSA